MFRAQVLIALAPQLSGQQLAAALEAALPGADGAVVEDYGKGVLVPEVVQAVIAAARRSSSMASR